MTGFFVRAILSTSLKSVISNEAILYIFALYFFNKSTALMLNGVLNNSILSFFANLNASLCQLNGV